MNALVNSGNLYLMYAILFQQENISTLGTEIFKLQKQNQELQDKIDQR